MRYQTANTIIGAFEENWIFRGHGVPDIVLSDQGPSVDGQEFRKFCKLLGIEKRHTTPYHPQADGMAERNIGTVKQVISCMLFDRNLPKGTWPSLLTEVSFYMNQMENATTQIAPCRLTYGRLPRSPTDVWCRNMRDDEVNTHGEFLRTLQRKKEELECIAKENSERHLDRVRTKYNQEKEESSIERGSRVMLKVSARSDALEPRFEGPYEVLDRRGPDVKLKRQRKIKWHHLSRCKLYWGTR